MDTPAMSLQDWLDDLCVRFIINLPQEDLASVARICFQVEEAQWFYEDFIRPLDPQLPSMPLRLFCMNMFQHCPLLASFSEDNHIRAFDEFMKYKTRVPVRGAIMLNEDMDSAVLVKGWKKSAGWSFPRGKINKDEDDLECAIREVDEETGFDIRAAGLVPKNEPVKFIELLIREQNIRLYVFRGVPMDTSFQPRTRKEISKIEWYKLADLPAFRKKGAQGQDESGLAEKANKFYMVAPFLVQLRKWVMHQKKRDVAAEREVAPAAMALRPALAPAAEEPVTEDDGWPSSLPPPPMSPPTIADPGQVVASLEDTTRELHRLLSLQTSAANPVTTPPAGKPVDRNKGASLLALLQAKNVGLSKSPENPALHTPLAQVTTATPPQPPMLHRHEHTNRPAAAEPGMPGFPVAPLSGPTAWPDASLHPENDDASLKPSHNITHLPVLPDILHPRPLPPQARSLLSGEAYPLPQATVAEQQAAAGTDGHPRTRDGRQQQQHHLHHDHHHPQQADVPKKGPGPHSTGRQYENVRHHPQFIQATSMPEPPKSLQLLELYSGGGKSPAYGRPDHVPEHGRVDFRDYEAAVGKSAPPTENHRSTLLDMFKRAEGSPSFSRDGDARGPAGDARGQAGDSRGQAGNSRGAGATPDPKPVAEPTQFEPWPDNVDRVRRQHDPSSNHAEIRRGVFSVLTPPGMVPEQQQQRQQWKQQQQQTRPASLSNGPPSRGPAGSAAATSPLFSTIYGPRAANGPSILTSPPAASAFPAPGLLHRTPDHPPEHKQKLLALFGKPATETASSSRLGSGTVARIGDSGSGSQPKSREPTRSSDGREAESHITPADRNFLLGYLESITNKAT